MRISLTAYRYHSRFMVLPVIILLLFALVTVSGCGSTGGSIRGKLAPDFTLSDLEGNPVSLSDFRGKTVLINFWATWCPPCRSEMPAIKSVYQEYKDKGVEVIGVDLKESENAVREFIEEGGYNWTFVLDGDGSVSRDYRITGIPESFFVTREGIIREMHIGPMSAETIEEKLKRAMH